MKENLESVLAVTAPFEKNNEISYMAKKLGYEIEIKSPIEFSGRKKIFLTKFLPSKKIILFDDLLKNIKEHSAVGLNIAQFLWDDPTKNIPEYWKDYELVFGDILRNNKFPEAKFILSLRLAESRRNWKYFFKNINNPLSCSARLVSLK